MYEGQRPDLAGLGAMVRECRKALDLTQVQLAERLGWNQERVSVLETGKYGLPSLPLLSHLAEVLGLPLSAVMEAAGFSVRGIPEQPAAPEPREDVGSMDAIRLYTLQRLLGIQALTLQDALNEASDLVAEAMGADKIDVFLFQPETQTLVALGTSNTPMGRRQIQVGLDRVAIANGGRQVQVFVTGKEYYSGHADQDPEMDRGVVHTLGVRSLYAVPLHVDGSIRGIVVAESVHPDRFSPAERDFFNAASRWIGMVAHRAQLHEAVTQQSVEEARRQVAGEMLETVAHDLQNQITPIKGEVDLLRRQLQREARSAETAQITRVSRSLRRLSLMVRELLDASRLEGGLFSLVCRPMNLVDAVHGVVDSAMAERPEMEVRGPDQLILEADEARVVQTLQNLVGNAIQHTPAGVPIVVHLSKRQGEHGEWAVVDVHDEGPGIPENLLSSLFDRYTSHGESAGHGLGLYLARGIADAHGGDLTVTSEMGKGTTFTLALPIHSGKSDGERKEPLSGRAGRHVGKTAPAPGAVAR